MPIKERLIKEIKINTAKESNFFKSTLIYFAGSVSTKVISFFMLPLYTEYINVGDMGYYDMALGVITFFATILFFDIGGGIMRFMFDKDSLLNKYTAIYSGLTIFIFSLAAYIIISIIIGLTVPVDYFIWIALYGLFQCINSVYGFVTRGFGNNILFAGAGVVSTIVNVLCNLYFILVLKWDYKALYISHIIAMVINIIILEFKFKLLFNIKKQYIDKKLIKEILKFVMPLCINAVIFWFLNSANKLIVSIILDTTQNGYLAVANKFTSIVYLIASCFQFAWQELAYSKDNKLEEAKTGEFYSNAFNLYSKFIFIGLIVSIPLISLIFSYFVDASYSASRPLIPLALLGTIMTILSTFLGSIFGGIKKTKVIFVSTFLGAIVNILIILLLIKSIGVMAANIALLAGFSLNVILRIIVLHKLINLKVNYLYFVLFILLYIGITYVYNNFNWIGNLISFILMSGVGLFILRKEIIEIFKKLFNNKKIARIE